MKNNVVNPPSPPTPFTQAGEGSLRSLELNAPLTLGRSLRVRGVISIKFLSFFLFFIAVISVIAIWFWYPKKSQIIATPASFQKLSKWHNSDPRAAINALKYSCKAILNMPKDKNIGTDLLPLKAENLWSACQNIPQNQTTAKIAREYFEKYFSPMQIEDRKKQVQGKFTGYYMPLLQARKTRSAEYSVPLYATPKDLVSANLQLFDVKCQSKRIIGRVKNNCLIPYYTRSEIEAGAIKKNTEVLAWVKNPFERLILEIEGSGAVEYKNGKKEYIGYATFNGHHYRSLPQLLIEKGYLEKDNASYSKIRAFFKSHPKLMKPLLNHNDSFVFFRKLTTHNVIGAEGVPLTPGISMAVDLRFIPLGLPLWVDFTDVDVENKESTLRRLMLAQDTGGAIVGPVRGDFFWGEGESAQQHANYMHARGTYWVLVPKSK